MIYFECKADEELITVLGITRRERMHAGNKPGVCKLLQKDRGSVGMIDEDHNSIQSTYIDEMTEVNYQEDIRSGSDVECGRTQSPCISLLARDGRGQVSFEVRDLR